MANGWNAFKTDQQLGIRAEITTVPGGSGAPIHAYVARPTTPGPHPGVVTFHHMPGWDEFTQEFCERLARHGYIVICPNLFESFGHGTPTEISGRVREAGGIHDEGVVADGKACLEWLQEQPDYNGKTGLIGCCSGGRHALLIGSTVSGFAAIADLWGGGVMGQESEFRPVAPVKYTEQLNIPLLGLFGNDDHFPPPDQVDAHEQELKRQGKDYEFHRYDGAAHGFFAYDSERYNQAATMDGWERIFEFFDRELSA